MYLPLSTLDTVLYVSGLTKTNMRINFQCRKCGVVFDCDVGTVTVSEESGRPVFEKSIVCPKCGLLSPDGVFLTELGQSQLTEATLDFDFYDLSEHPIDDSADAFVGECQGCDLWLPLNDLGLCEQCAGKLDRDFIRQRQWDYSVMAYGVPKDKREDIRKAVIDQYGEQLELILPSKGGKKAGSPAKTKKRKGRRARR